MTDRELIDMAAKAAGIVGEWMKDVSFVQDRWYFNVPYENYNLLTGFEWNPLIDDGDAFRLAVKLGFVIDTHATRVCYGETFDIGEPGFRDVAATRRAIVRAAAEIGRAM